MDVKTTCLGVLAMGDATGYEIRKAFEDGPFSHFADGGFGSIYPALTKAETEGLVTCKKMAQEKRPAKKIYAITPAGRMALLAALQQEPGEDKFRSNFLFTLFYADYQPASWIEQVIDQRILEYREKVTHLESCAQNKCESVLTGPNFVLGMGIAHYRAALKYLEDEKHTIVAAALRGENIFDSTNQVAE